MADKKINDYTAATAIENTTSFIAQTVSGTTQRVPLSVMKDNITNEFSEKGTVVFNDDDGVSTAYLTLTSGHCYKIYISAQRQLSGENYVYTGKKVITFIFEGTSFDIAVSVIDLDISENLSNSYLAVGAGGILASSKYVSLKADFLYYKVIDMGVAQ